MEKQLLSLRCGSHEHACYAHIALRVSGSFVVKILTNDKIGYQ